MKRVLTDNKDLQAVQDSVDQALKNSPLSGGSILGTLVKPISLSSGSNAIAHGLKRRPQYWTLLDNTANATVYRTNADATTIYLTASGATTVIVWVS